ncbi:LysE family translocator [Azospirillum picis]|uniref:Threonine/homoserine/homoserine lactone efflux protein n=1 Tax=Azospirillum picis TaxID=488438 RepID=A0ABU0MG66_9PROT|nr:LysE family transporter [Azospirillum picis]MBP2298526.1 threonine/homoserine/homoserine lactone efflux protein [Azospirillum picis]MDQ0532425.1 threonine/homoserine/homoserine lactone efflux protein [Azospirillum picis]
MTVEHWLVYLLAAVGLSLTPGPNGLLSLTNGVRFGLARTVFTALGGICGFLLLVAASLAGMGALLAASETAFSIAKWAGAVYLAYLGIRLFRAPPPNVDEADAGGSVREATARRLFLQGFLVAASNPKALIFFAAFLPQFMVPGIPYWEQFVVLGGTFAVVEFIYELILAGTAQRIAPWIGRHGRLFNRATGAMFVGIGGILAGASRT